MSSVSTAFKVHYNQKLGEPIRSSWGCTMASGGIDAPGPTCTFPNPVPTFVIPCFVQSYTPAGSFTAVITSSDVNVEWVNSQCSSLVLAVLDSRPGGATVHRQVSLYKSAAAIGLLPPDFSVRLPRCWWIFMRSHHVTRATCRHFIRYSRRMRQSKP